jgi:hypothetical protein
MSRYESLLSELSGRVTAEMTPEEIEQLAEPLERLNEEEKATAKAYKVCGCGTEYTEAQWAHLQPAVGRKWALDPFVREEWRECSNCGSSLAILESNGRRKPADTIAVRAVADSFHACGHCLKQINPGVWYVERWERKARVRALGRWAFCSKKCEAL